MTNEVTRWIEKPLRQKLSPQQVVDYLEKHKKVSLHHDTDYQIVYADKAEGGDLYKNLRVVSKPYRKRYGPYGGAGRLKTGWILMIAHR